MRKNTERTETVVLKGQITRDDLERFNDMVMQDNVKTVDVSGLTIDLPDDDLAYDLLEYECEPSVIVKMLLNKCFSQQFTIDDDYVLSTDGKVLVNSFDKNAFSVPEGVEIIGNLAFCCNGFDKLTIPDGIKQIGYAAFHACDKLTDLILSDSVEQIGETAFGSCDIEQVQLSRNLRAIPDACFEYNSLDEIDIPSSVKRIGSDAFHCNFIESVRLPEGVESIGWNVFTHANEYIYFPSTMKEIEKDFFYEDCIDIPRECVPFIEVSANNPIFFSKEGTLYTYDNPDEPYLGYKYESKKEELEDAHWIIFAENPKTKEYSCEEIMAMYEHCIPLNDEGTMFRIYDKKLSSNYYGYNIIDRCLNYYLNENLVHDVDVCKNHFVLLNKKVIYSIDLKTVLLSEFDGYSFSDCDDDGRIYVTKYVPVPKERLRIHYYMSTTLRAGCININKEILIPCVYDGFKAIGKFNKDGLAITHKGSKYGMIDIYGNIVIPFDYHYIFSGFDENGIAFVVKQSKGTSTYMYINRKNEVVGTLLDFHFNGSKQEFFLYTHNGKFGYAKTGALHYSAPIYQDIRTIDDTTIEVSLDGVHYETIRY